MTEAPPLLSLPLLLGSCLALAMLLSVLTDPQHSRAQWETQPMSHDSVPFMSGSDTDLRLAVVLT